MSILIKGMEMPIKCAKCPIADISAEYYFCEKIDWFGKERPSDCPLTELPPHGRLGDLDALKAQYKYGEADSEDEKLWIMNIRRAITNAPTVIEAEDGT